MPQFVRLVNTTDGARNIRNNFKDQFILPADSKVSLVDCNVRFKQSINGEQFNVQNEQIVVTLPRSATYTMTVPDNYTGQTTFLNAIRDNLNYQNTITRVGASPLQGGYIDWDYTLNDNTVTFTMAEVGYNVIPDYTTGEIDPNPAPGGSTLGAGEIQVPDTANLSYISKSHLTRGRYKIYGTYRQTNANVKFGALLDTDSLDSGASFFGLYIPGAATGGNYELYYNNTSVQDLGRAPANNDVVQLFYQGGQVRIVIAGVTIGTYDLTVLVPGLTSTVLSQEKRLHYVNFALTGTTGLTGGINGAIVTEAIPANYSANTVSIAMSANMATYLGYNETTIQKTCNSGQAVQWPGDEKVAGEKTSQGILVTLEGVGRVGSFDGESGTASDVVAVLPETANISGTNDVVHTTPYKYSLDLRNQTALRVNNLFVRFRTRLSEQPLELRSGSMVTLLFE